MADYMHFSLRLNRELPEHYKIIKFLDEMDPKKYKSKTKFLADALYFYIQCIENGSLEKLKNPHFWENSAEFVTRGEFDSRLALYDKDVRTDLDADEVATAEDINVLVDSDFDVTNVKDGISFDDTKVSVAYAEDMGDFDLSKAGRYDTYYLVEPYSGKAAYLIHRTVSVNEPETTEAPKNESTEEEGDSDDDPEPIVGDERNPDELPLSEGEIENIQSSTATFSIILDDDQDAELIEEGINPETGDTDEDLKEDEALNDENESFFGKVGQLFSMAVDAVFPSVTAYAAENKDKMKVSYSGYAGYCGHRTGIKYISEEGDYYKHLRACIDNALAQHPANLDELLKLLQESGCEVSRRGKSYRLKLPEWDNVARLDSLGEGYSLEDLLAVLSGQKEHTPRKKTTLQAAPPKVNLLVDIQAKLQAGKGAGYARWAKVFNLKQMAQTMNYLSEHNLLEYAVLEEKTAAATAHHNELSAQIKAAEKRMAEIAVLRTHIINYAKTREVYVAYRKAGYSKKFLAEHEADILLHKAAKNAFDDMGVKKLPNVKSLQTEYAKVLEEKKKAYAEYRRSREEMRELLTAKANVDRLLNMEAEHGGEKKKDHAQR